MTKERSKSYESLIENFVKWAENCPDIRAAFILGSHAREDHAADRWSDMDVMFFAVNPQEYLAQTDWLENVGSVWITLLNAGGKDVPLLRVLFEKGFDVDFIIYPDNYLKELIRDGVYPRSFHGGVRVILDKDDLAKKIIPPYFCSLPVRPPTRAAFLDTVDFFWHYTFHTAKLLLRGELWLCQIWDPEIKKNLLMMLQWHAKAVKGWDFNTWYNGKYLSEWADPRAVKEIEMIFAPYDKEDNIHALLATTDLFRWLAKETAQLLNYAYPQDLDDNISNWLKENLPVGQRRV